MTTAKAFWKVHEPLYWRRRKPSAFCFRFASLLPLHSLRHFNINISLSIHTVHYEIVLLFDRALACTVIAVVEDTRTIFTALCLMLANSFMRSL